MTWDDITSSAEWDSADRVGAWEGYNFDHQCQTVGWLAGSHEEFVVIAATRTRDDKNLNLAQRIPRGCIRRIEDLGVVGGRGEG